MRIKIYTQKQQALAVALAPMLLVGCMSLPGATMTRLSVKKHEPFIIAQTEDVGWGNASHVFLARVSSNRIAATYWVGGDGASSGTAPISWPAYTDDGGLTWQFGNPYDWIQPPERGADFSFERGEFFSRYNMGYFFNQGLLPNGSRVAYGRQLLSKGGYTGIRSEDGGLTWSLPEAIPLEYPEKFDALSGIYAEGPGVVLNDGRYLIIGGARSPRAVYNTVVFESRDEGRSFRYFSTVATPDDTRWAKGGPSEPTLLALPGRELLAVMRTKSGGSYSGKDVAAPLLLARSKDGGATWSKQRLPYPGVSPKLLRMSNGVLVLGFGRPGNNLVFSVDDGYSWGAEVRITRPDQPSSGYLGLIEVAPGRLLVVFDLMGAPLEQFWLWEPKRINGLAGIYVDVSQRF